MTNNHGENYIRIRNGLTILVRNISENPADSRTTPHSGVKQATHTYDIIRSSVSSVVESWYAASWCPCAPRHLSDCVTRDSKMYESL